MEKTNVEKNKRKDDEASVNISARKTLAYFKTRSYPIKRRLLKIIPYYKYYKFFECKGN